MRILQIPTEVTAEQPVRHTAATTEPAVTAGALERIVSALREKIRQLEDRIQQLEQAPKIMPAPVPAKAPAPVRLPISPVTVDAEAFKKNLLNKMWKYLQEDERPSKAI